MYYQFVSRAWLENTEKEYKRLAKIVTRARRAGLIDWTAIEDRTRWLRTVPMWDGPKHHLRANVEWYSTDKWADQPERVEVWIEKDALAGVFQTICEELEVPYFPARGYVSEPEMWGGAQRLNGYVESGQQVWILHFGDHDPSGMDMTRDIVDRMLLFADYPSDTRNQVDVERIALNMEQVREYDPPPNPAKLTDPRSKKYRRRYGESSWELDALEPAVLRDLVLEHVLDHRDEERWQAAVDKDEENQRVLLEIADRYDEVRDQL